MITAWKEYCVSCDMNKDHNCWGEESEVIRLDESKTVAFKKLKKRGWKLDEPNMCPYCHKGILKKY